MTPTALLVWVESEKTVEQLRCLKPKYIHISLGSSCAFFSVNRTERPQEPDQQMLAYRCKDLFRQSSNRGEKLTVVLLW